MVQPGSISAVVDLNSTELVVVSDDRSVCGGRVNNAAGIDIIHINTELRVAWRRGLEDAFAQKPREVVPYKLLPIAEESVKQIVGARLRLFNQPTQVQSVAR